MDRSEGKDCTWTFLTSSVLMLRIQLPLASLVLFTWEIRIHLQSLTFIGLLANRAIENAITPYYKHVRPVYLSKLDVPVGDDVMKSASLPDLPKEVFQMLTCIGPYLHRNVLLLQKVSM